MRLQLIFGIHRATHQIGLFIQRSAAGLTQAEAHILCHLHESGPATVSALHQAFAHRRSTLTSVLDRLAASGMIVRESSQADRRSFIISLTKAGKSKAAKVHRVLESLESSVLQNSAPKKLEAFNELLHKLEQQASKGTTK
ncbi:MAG: MarR family transcriptional regulator [Bryobacteraceae bacterium]